MVTLLSTRRSPITTYCGVIYRKDTIMKHISSAYHNKCIMYFQQNIEGIKQSDETPQANYISKANSHLADKIGSLLITMYYDANKLILPEYYFPARSVVNMMESKFKYNSDDNIIINTDLQYLIHKELLSIIRYTYMETLYNKN